MNKDENFLKVMIEFISLPEKIFIVVPIHLFMGERFQRLFVKFVSSDNRKVWAYLSFKINDSSQAEC